MKKLRVDFWEIGLKNYLIDIKVNGLMVKDKDMVLFITLMVVNMKAFGIKILSMEKQYLQMKLDK